MTTAVTAKGSAIGPIVRPQMTRDRAGGGAGEHAYEHRADRVEVHRQAEGRRELTDRDVDDDRDGDEAQGRRRQSVDRTDRDERGSDEVPGQRDER